jgi:cytochrome c peroxidase
MARNIVTAGLKSLALVLGLLVLTLLPSSTALAGDLGKKIQDPSIIRNLQPYLDGSGFISTYNVNGNIDTKGAFFQDLGTNGRSCATCHAPSQAFSFSTQNARRLFVETRGRDPLFAPVDGANCPTGNRGDVADHTMILGYGDIRIGIAQATKGVQFTVEAVSDPYGCAIDTSTGQQVLSFYRRPLPATNLRFLSAVMFDGRQTIAPLNNPTTFAANLNTDLTSQAVDALRGHSQASTLPSASTLQDIVNFEAGLSTAQVWDFGAGPLWGGGAQAGVLTLAQQNYFPGINDSLTPNIFTPNVFTLYSSWLDNNGWSRRDRARADIAAGEKLFNSFPINITSVRGLNDNAALGKPAVITGTCGTCHDAPNVGDHSEPVPLDIGTSHVAAYEMDPQIKAALAELSYPDLPVYKITGCTDPFTGASPIYTTDLGKGALTGQCGDVNRIKGPILRGLAGRAPYFHNGAAATLDEVINYYNQRFNMGLTEQQKAQFVAFLKTL